MNGLFGGLAPDAETAGAFSRLDFQSKGTEAQADEAANRTKAQSVLPKGGWPIVDQRYRNTCVPFAACAAMELFQATGDTPKALSPDYLYNRMRDGLSSGYIDRVKKVLPDYDLGATLLAQALCTFRDIGCVFETERPYQQTVPVFNIDGARPSIAQNTEAAANKQADFYYAKVRVDSMGNIDPDQTFQKPGAPTKKVTAADVIYTLLKAKSAVAVGIPVYQLPDARMNWTAPATMRFGYVPYPGTDTQYDAALVVASGHAVCITGYVPVTNAPGGGYFIFRNSWGLDFRSTPADPIDGVAGNLVPQGYGVMSAASVDKYVWEMLAPTKPGMMDATVLPQCT